MEKNWQTDWRIGGVALLISVLMIVISLLGRG